MRLLTYREENISSVVMGAFIFRPDFEKRIDGQNSYFL